MTPGPQAVSRGANKAAPAGSSTDTAAATSASASSTRGGGGSRKRSSRAAEEEEQEQRSSAAASAADPHPSPHPLGERLGSLPGEITAHQVLPFLDGASLAQWARACHVTKQQATHAEPAWDALWRREFGWVYPHKPSFLTGQRLYGYLRRATAALVRADPSGDYVWGAPRQWRPGRLTVVGGSVYRPYTVDDVDAFVDAGAARVNPGGWPCPFQRHFYPRLGEPRSAPGVVRDWEEGVWAVGGWGDDERALASVEVLGVEQPPPPEQSQEDEEEEEEEEEGTTWQPDWVRKRGWEDRPALNTPRCFLAAALDEAGRVFAIGGGESIWQGATVYASTEVYDSFQDPRGQWRPGPAMTVPRCGHAAGSSDSGDIYVAGGYGGGTDYLASIEMLPSGGGDWVALDAGMQVPRTGFGMTWGPDRCFYVAGGSPDGIRSHKTAERFDPREGRWHPLPSMVTPRGYCAGAFGASGLFYVAGGQATDDLLLPSVEAFDPRAGRWRLLPASVEEGRGLTRVDLAMVYTLF